MFRPDLLFSYWIFLWYIVYILGGTTYNPTFALLFAITFNLCMLINMLFYTDTITIIIFIFSISLFKIIPLFSIRHSITNRDMIATFVLAMFYLGWLYISGISLDYTIKEANLVIHNKTDLPFTSVVKSFLKIKRNE